jgi:hypothetical protein
MVSEPGFLDDDGLFSFDIEHVFAPKVDTFEGVC